MSVSVFCQTKTEGKILDATTNSPLSGAKIKSNYNQMTSSDEDGIFLLKCEENMTLTISYMGYETQTININNCNTYLNINMKTSDNVLDEISLEGEKVPIQDLEKPRSEVELSVNELKRGTGLFLDDAINANVPGVTMYRRGVSSGQQFNIRGYGNGVGFKGANNNFDGQGYKVYLNNIPITDAEGVTVMDDIDFGSVGHVDVIKGPAGSLYGLSIAGVVNLQTNRPKNGETSLEQKVLVGSYGLASFITQFQMGQEKTALMVNYSHQIADGFMDHTASTKDFLNMVLDYRPSDKQFISTYFGYSNSYDERGGELTIDQYNDFDYSGNARYIKNNAHSEVISFRAGLSYNYQFLDWLGNTTSVFGSSITSNSSSAAGWTDKNPNNYGVRSTFDLNFELGTHFILTGVAGFEFQEQRAQITGYKMIENPSDPEGYNMIGETKSNQFSDSKNSSIFTEWTLNMPLDFSVTAGISTSSMRIQLENRLYIPNSTNPNVVTANYTDLFSPHIAINKVFNNNVSVYASYSKGYKAPVSGNIVLSTSGTLNTGLVPEVGNQIEIGTKGNILNNKLQYQFAIFNAIFKNKFTSVAVPLDINTTAYTYIANGGKQNNKGIEVLLKYTAYQSTTGFFSNISPYANTTYSDFKYDDFSYQSLNSDGEAIIADYNGNAVAGVAPWVVNAGIDFNSNIGIYGTINYEYRDTVPFTSDNLNYADAYNLLNSKLGYRFSLNHFDLDVYAGVNNITGTQYYYMLFLNQLNDAYLPAPYEANFYGGVNLKYHF
ncbi:TonB-dependent receptor [Bizionia arctica]|uniref:TonB-dependent receptor n=2 Tax=Bizionia arctica TaxID=1495645 RepID=A0A917GGW3_9FLAO|nr:TonB-dependent receptor [Bizionia arctica]